MIEKKQTVKKQRKKTQMALLVASVPLSKCTNVTSKRSLYYWLTLVWNRVDEERIKEVGPDRACAEWLLRNGASIKWKGDDKFLADYNALPDKKDNRSCIIQAVNAIDSSIHHTGFPHFSGCKYIEDVKLIDCKYLGNQAIDQLKILKESLKYLEISHCLNVTDEAIIDLKNLTNLKILKLKDMHYVENKDGVERELSEALPNCTIEWK